MAITLIQHPPAFTFSGNFIPVKFQTDNDLEQAGRVAVNRLGFTLSGDGLQVVSIAPGTVVTIKYGATVLTMTAVDGDADDSGTQFPAGSYFQNLAPLVPYFQANYTLSSDFIITHSGRASIQFTARRFGRAYEFQVQNGDGWGTDYTVGGLPEIARPNFGIQFELHVEREDQIGFDMVYSNILPIGFGPQKEASADLSESLHTILQNGEYDIPGFSDITPVPCAKTCRRYFFRFGEAYGEPRRVRQMSQSDTYTVLIGKLSYVGQVEKTLPELLQPVPGDPLQDRFLRQSQGLIRPLTNLSQPQFLYFFNTRQDSPGARLKVKYQFSDGSLAEGIVSVFDMFAHRKYAFNVRLDKIYVPSLYENKTVAKYEIWIESSTGSRISEIIGYEVDYAFEKFLRYFVYLDSWGAMQTMRTTGMANSSYDLQQQTAARIRRSGYTLPSGDLVAFDIRMRDKYRVNSGWLTNDELVMTRDFVLSIHKFRFHKGRLLPIVITTTDMAEKDDSLDLQKQLFEYKYQFEDDAFTERSDSDVEPIDADPPRIAPIFYGASLTAPDSYQDILTLTSQSETIFEWVMMSGTHYRFFSVAVPYWKELHQVFDQRAEELLTTEFHRRPVFVKGEEYFVYTMEVAVPYSSDHRFLVTIKNLILPGPIPKPEDLLIYYGVRDIPAHTGADIKALNPQVAGIDQFTMGTGDKTVFVVALPARMAVYSVFDQTAGEEITEGFVMASVSVDGQQYSVYQMQVANSYSTSHTLKIILQNGNSY